jgi:O-antigen/teichoic acid export membrane protein
MLKGVGEQVFSMWVNISDSFISIILVWTLIPRLGILGYALAIIGMEAYNFALSAFRLRRHVSFKIDLIASLAVPGALSYASAVLARRLFSMNGAVTTPLWLILKMLFALCIFIGAYMLVRLFASHRKSKKILEKC